MKYFIWILLLIFWFVVWAFLSFILTQEWDDGKISIDWTYQPVCPQPYRHVCDYHSFKCYCSSYQLDKAWCNEWDVEICTNEKWLCSKGEINCHWCKCMNETDARLKYNLQNVKIKWLPVIAE
jgi:hypothetical protein